MKDFVFYNPTQIVFGEGKTSEIGKYLQGKNVCFCMAQAALNETVFMTEWLNLLKNMMLNSLKKWCKAKSGAQFCL